MITFLFWNLKRKNRLAVLGRLVKNHGIDMIMLAESSLGITDVLLELNSGDDSSSFHYNPGNCERIAIFSKFAKAHVSPIHEDHTITIRHLKPPGTRDMLVAVAHLPSKLHQSIASQSFAITEIAKDISRMEEKIGHKRTLLVGDLNMNPFEYGIVAASGLHATMDRRIAMKGERIIGGKSFPFFYNPMWSLFGDASLGPPGTYYRREASKLPISGICSIRFFCDPNYCRCFRMEICP
ncbi:MAG: endonuclease/exonuclease/phosphatase family protein [Proteobacteria bacterium]|nr:endonuclease/exonuclease/phosphatase family protein [Pseudomonadota bacterium]